MNRLQKKIMRRVYYVYAMRLLAQPALLHGFFMLALLTLLTYFVSLGNVLHNMITVAGNGSLSRFAMNAVLNTEAWTLLILGLFIFSAFSLRITLSPAKRKLVLAN